MGRLKKGVKKKADLWQECGGRSFLVKSFTKMGFGDDGEPTAEQWSDLTSEVFKKQDKMKEKWLKLIWRLDRRGIQSQVLKKGEL